MLLFTPARSSRPLCLHELLHACFPLLPLGRIRDRYTLPMSFAILATLCRPSALLATHSLRYAFATPTVRRPAMSAAEAPVPPPTPVRPTFRIAAQPHPATLLPSELLKQCDVKHTRGSGPGGQHRNKVNTACVINHRPTDVSASAYEDRSQARNSANALIRLRIRLALQLRSQPPPTEPSALWMSRVKSGKLAVSESHEDFPAVLCEALDWIDTLDDAKAAAQALGVSSSQMVKLLAKEPAALELVNRMRASKGVGPLRDN